MEISRRHLPLDVQGLKDLLDEHPNFDRVRFVGADGIEREHDADFIRQQLEKGAEVRPTVDEPFFLEGTRNQRRVQKKLMRKATKAGKRK